MSKRYEVLSVNDDRDFCECCGKTGLKRVVYIRDSETGEVKHFGATCAASPVKGFGLDNEIKTAIKRSNDRAKALNYYARHEYRRAGGAYVLNGSDSWAPADPALYSQVRASIEARGFNY